MSNVETEVNFFNFFKKNFLKTKFNTCINVSEKHFQNME